jgi:hypothetical protein
MDLRSSKTCGMAKSRATVSARERVRLAMAVTSTRSASRRNPGRKPG